MNAKEIFFYERTLKHISLVTQNALRVIDNKDILKKYNIDELTLMQSVHNHDRTKFSEPQKMPYIEISWFYYKQSKGEEYPLGKVLSSNATILHIVSEPHHPEYWDKEFLITPNKLNMKNRDGLPLEPVKAYSMPLCYIAEMVCDWAAVSKERGGDLKNWADKTVNKRWLFSEEQVALIYDLMAFFEER